MQENIILDDTKPDGYQIFITGITWSRDTVGKYFGKKDFSDSLPDQMTLVLPETLANTSDSPSFNDDVETFVYNLLMRRFNHIAHHCQIWLPFEEIVTT